jgi:hypothetical protein
MATAGYPGTPLFKKLGIKPGTKALLINQPAHYDDLLEVTISNQVCSKNDVPDVVPLFGKNFERI